MPLTIKPFGYKILIEETKRELPGKIQLPDSTNEQGALRHTIIAIGDDKVLASGERIKIDLKVGQDIMFDTRAAAQCGPQHMFEGRILAVVSVDDVLGVYDGELDRVLPKIVTPTKRVQNVFQ